MDDELIVISDCTMLQPRGCCRKYGHRIKEVLQLKPQYSTAPPPRSGYAAAYYLRHLGL